MRIGLISDTHLPDYLETLPETIRSIFAGVDLILHAGDVGQLSVLDFLAECGAPVVAVLGNDEEVAATRATLPTQQLVSVASERIFIVHGNRQDPEAERAMRADDRWEPKLRYLADLGKQHGASVVVSGHTHIPWSLTFDDVLLINPGAIAPGGFLMRLNRPSVVVLDLPSREVTYYHALTGAVLNVDLDLAAGFDTARDAIMTPIVTAELKAQVSWFQQHVYPLSPETLRPVIRACAIKCWRYEAETYGIPEVCAALKASHDVPAAVFETLRGNPAFAPFV